MQRDDAVNSALCDAVLEFLSATVHTVLKARSIYSPELFENRRLYGISVSQCRHPDVCLYVGTVLGNLKPLLANDTLQELVVAFYDNLGQLVSKVSFIIQGFNAAAAPPDWSGLEPAFRSALLRLHFSDNLLRPLPEGSTFELLAVATSRAGVNPQVFLEEPSTQAVLLQQPATGLPLNSCSLPGVLSMQVVLEEGPAAAAAAAATQTGSEAAAAAAAAGTSAGAAASQAGQGEEGLPQLQLRLPGSGQLLSQSQEVEDD
uniref:HORMA domain-containing protein n=1 Tax=Tetradesmus obliquus TaxID=3088 RepID=A0A383V794_TETOB|eukprot:jgi/Sobl393_1/9403/SZX61468.1